MNFDHWVGVFSILSTIISFLAYLHQIKQGRPQSTTTASHRSVSAGRPEASSLSTAYASIIGAGVFAALTRQLLSIYLIANVGIDQRFPDIKIFGHTLYHGDFIVKLSSFLIFGSLALHGTDIYAKRRRHISKTFAEFGSLFALISFLVTSLVLDRLLGAWWFKVFTP